MKSYTLLAIALIVGLPAQPVACRHGYTLSNHSLDYYGYNVIATLGGGHTYYYSAKIIYSNPTNLEVYQMASIANGEIVQPTSEIVAAAIAHPGAIWLVGNEPENPAQGNMSPATYARIYHEAVTLVRGADPSARFAIGGITQATPLRLQWLDMVLDEYERLYGEPLTPNWWNIHGYQFREVANSWGAGIPVGLTATLGVQYTLDDTVSVDKFSTNVVRFREWMKLHGYQNSPLMISEYGPHNPERYTGGWDTVNNYVLTGTMGYMANTRSPDYGVPSDGYKLVQRWDFYALDLWPGVGASYLVYTATRELTPLGVAWVKYVRDPRSGLAPCGPDLMQAVRQVYLPVVVGAWR